MSHSYYAATRAAAAAACAAAGRASAPMSAWSAAVSPGCSAALALAERGYRVVLLEAQRVGWGASGRSGGQAIVGTAAEQDDLERWSGAAMRARVWDISLARHDAAQAAHRASPHRLRLGRLARCSPPSSRASGARCRPGKPSWRTTTTIRSTRLIERDELRGTLAHRALHRRAVRSQRRPPASAALHARAWRAAAAQAGAQIHEDSRVTRYSAQQRHSARAAPPAARSTARSCCWPAMPGSAPRPGAAAQADEHRQLRDRDRAAGRTARA